MSKKKNETFLRVFEKRPVVFGLLLLIWLPFLISVFPGVIRNDEVASLKQIFGEYPYTNHHPIIFTMFLKVIYLLTTTFGGGMNTTVFIATLVQMLFFAFVLSLIFEDLFEKTENIIFAGFLIIFYICNPIIAKFAVSLGKDTFFACWFLLYIRCFRRMGNTPFYCYIFFAVMTALARSNGLYVVLAMCVVSVVWYALGNSFQSSVSQEVSGCTRNTWKKVLLYNLCIVALIGLIKGPVFNAFHVGESGKAESYTVLLQQIGYTLKAEGTFPEEDLEYLNQILPIEDWKEAYTPSISDSIKFHEHFNAFYFNDTASRFMQVWFRGLQDNFSHYVKAYLLLIRGYWDITQPVDVGSWDICVNEYGIERPEALVDVWDGIPRRLCVLSVQACLKLPLLNVFVCQPLILLLLIVSIVYTTINRRKGETVALFCCLFVWGTLFLAAPVTSQFRYVFSIYLCIPYMVYGLRKKKPEEKDAIDAMNQAIDYCDSGVKSSFSFF